MASRLLLVALLFSTSVMGAEVAGVKFEDRLEPQGLVLNGAGLRKRFFFQVYAIGLYLPKKTADAAEAVASPGPKRIAIHMLRDVGAAEFAEALADGIRANHSDAEAKALEPHVRALGAIMAEVKDARKGMAIVLDATPAGTRVGIDGKPAGAPIGGEAFFPALLRIWLGPAPVQDDLKTALLGG
jgi:hypothetical protein